MQHQHKITISSIIFTSADLFILLAVQQNSFILKKMHRIWKKKRKPTGRQKQAKSCIYMHCLSLMDYYIFIFLSGKVCQDFGQLYSNHFFI